LDGVLLRIHSHFMRLMQLVGLKRLLPRRVRRALLHPWNSLLNLEQHVQEKALYRRFVRPGDLVFDIGANVGLKTRVFLSLGARVIAVEPNPECAETIRQRSSRFLRSECLVVHQKAIGANPGKIALQLFEGDHTITSGSPAFVSIASEKGLTNSAMIEVDVVTLDQLLAHFGRPKFVKIDVEGMDLEALRGCHFRPEFLSFEFNTVEVLWRQVNDCLAEASRLGFSMANFTGPGTARLQLQEWVGTADVPSRILEWAHGAETFGDIILS
jgi:FkbM family methyltransferase